MARRNSHRSSSGPIVGSIASVQRYGDKNFEYLKGLAKFTRDTGNIFDDDQLASIRNSINELGYQTALVEFEGVTTEAECRCQLADGKMNSEESEEQVIKRIKQAVEGEVAAFNASKSDMCQEIASLLQPNAKALGSNADEIEIVEQRLTENDFLCPFTTKRFEHPMKNSNCPHRISKAGLDAMLKGKREANCVQPGCREKWSRSSSSEDIEFSQDMERFFRQKNMIHLSQMEATSSWKR